MVLFVKHLTFDLESLMSVSRVKGPPNKRRVDGTISMTLDKKPDSIQWSVIEREISVITKIVHTPDQFSQGCHLH